MKKIILIVFISILYFSCDKEVDWTNCTTDAQVVGFVLEKCYCCWGWVIKVGSDTIKTERIPSLDLIENTVFPIKARITIGSKTIDCSGNNADYYEIKEFSPIK